MTGSTRGPEGYEWPRTLLIETLTRIAEERYLQELLYRTGSVQRVLPATALAATGGAQAPASGAEPGAGGRARCRTPRGGAGRRGRRGRGAAAGSTAHCSGRDGRPDGG